MALTAGEEIQKRRVARKRTRAQVAAACHVSVDVIDRIESGETKEPHPDLIDMIGEAVGDPGLWPAWMAKQYISYARRHGPPTNHDLPGALLCMEAEVLDLLDPGKLQQLRRDIADGRLDSEELRSWLVKEGKQANEAIGRLLSLVAVKPEGGRQCAAAGGY